DAGRPARDQHRICSRDTHMKPFLARVVWQALHDHPINFDRPLWEELRPEHVPEYELKHEGDCWIVFGDLRIELYRDGDGWLVASHDPAPRSRPDELELIIFEKVRDVLRVLERASYCRKAFLPMIDPDPYRFADPDRSTTDTETAKPRLH